MPFYPGVAIIYLSLSPLLWLSVFMLQTREQLKSFAKGLAWLIVVSGIGFLLLPGEDVRTRTVGTDFFDQIYVCADWINMSNNYLPSLHVGMAILCAGVYSRTASLKTSVLIWLWAAAIALSTLLMHEHYLADVITGGVLGYSIANLTDSSRLCSSFRNNESANTSS
jgi:membrane-associated phospholipid phosphatase